MSEWTEQAAADRYCRTLANRHYENFSIGALHLPADLRLHLARVYAYCRTTDDFGDESGAEGNPRLDSWQKQVNALFDGAAPTHPVLFALKSTAAAFRLDRRPFLDLIAANRQDQRVHSYQTWEELRAYCDLSAAPVGRIVLRLFRVEHPAAIPLSDDVCIGLQLANFAQDVRVDRAKGRSYLIGAELDALGLHGAIRALCDRAEGLLASGDVLESMVPRRLAFQLALYRRGGLAIIEAVRGMEYRTDERRPQVSKLAKVKLVPLALGQTARRKHSVSSPRTA